MENIIRLGVFCVVFFFVAMAEQCWPRRSQSIPRILRWPHNFALVAFNTFILRLAFPLSLAGFSLIVRQHGWGLFPLLNLPFWLMLCLSVLTLDLIIYEQHILFHKMPLLWRVHRVHHTDTEIDVTTALRFHPAEILVSMGIKFMAVATFGIPPEAALLFETILNASAMFNHGNIHIPVPIDSVLRWVLVTPDMHRVHHSVIAAETNSNYGFNIPLWDRLFRTYRTQPKNGHDAMKIGLEIFRTLDEQRFDKLLTQPFRKNV